MWKIEVIKSTWGYGFPKDLCVWDDISGGFFVDKCTSFQFNRLTTLVEQANSYLKHLEENKYK